MAPEDGYEITELIRLTKMTRATLYRRLREHASALTTNVHRLAEVDAACGGRESWGVGRTRATRYKRLHRRSSAGWSSRHLACPLKAVVLAAPAN